MVSICLLRESNIRLLTEDEYHSTIVLMKKEMHIRHPGLTINNIVQAIWEILGILELNIEERKKKTLIATPPDNCSGN